MIKLLTGIRRGGKSVLLEQIRDKINSPRTIFLNFEDLSNQHLCDYNVETILNYLKACEEAYLLYRFKSQDINGKKMLKVNETYYVADYGLREAVVGENLQNAEIVLENIVGLELLRRGYKICVGRVGAKEINFVGEKDGDKLYVQVCYLLNEEATVQREFGSLLEIKDNYPKYVLYKEGTFHGNYEGIPVKVEVWLMNKKIQYKL